MEYVKNLLFLDPVFLSGASKEVRLVFLGVFLGMDNNSPKQSASLAQLVEAAELIAMVEELLSVATPERLAPGLWPGIRVSLRNARRTILNSHDAFAGDLLQRARAQRVESILPETKIIESSQPLPIGPATQLASSLRTSGLSGLNGEAAMQNKRRDLRGALEKLTES